MTTGPRYRSHVGTPKRQLRTIELGDAPAAWSAAGFRVDGDRLRLGSTVLRLAGDGDGVRGWAIDGVADDVDGLRSVGPSDVETGAGAGDATHTNGIVSIDHVVVRTGDVDRTVTAFEAAGLEVRGGRSTTSYGSPMRQVFFWAGDVIVELVGPDAHEPATDEPTTFFGLALVSDDLDATAATLGELLSEPKDAVQAGRRIAGLRGGQVGITVPVAVTSPHVRPTD
jgi:hypothetical protein